MALRLSLRPSSVALRLMAHTNWSLISGGKSTAMPLLSAGGAGGGEGREGGGKQGTKRGPQMWIHSESALLGQEGQGWGEESQEKGPS